MSAMPRIELDQDDPAYDDIVTFTVTKARPVDKYSIHLVLGKAQDVNHYPPDATIQNTVGKVGDEFKLEGGDCTAVAWLLRDEVPQCGTLFWVQL